MERGGDSPAARPRRRFGRLALISVGVVLGLLLLDSAVLYSRLGSSGDRLSGSTAGGTTWLLLGSDRRGDVPAVDQKRFGTPAEVPGERADVIVALRVGDDGAVRTLGINRDLVAIRPNAGFERLSTTLQYGPDAIADALCRSLGLGVDHIAVVRFEGLRDLVDLAGGIDVASDAIVADRRSGLLLARGNNHLDGRLALAYVRARSIEVWDGDRWIPDPVRSAQRPQHAIEVIRELGSELDVNWADPIGLHRLAWTATAALTVDDGSGPFDLLGLARAARSLTSDDSRTLTTRVRGGPGSDVLPMADATTETFDEVAAFQGGRLPAGCSTPALRRPAG